MQIYIYIYVYIKDNNNISNSSNIDKEQAVQQQGNNKESRLTWSRLVSLQMSSCEDILTETETGGQGQGQRQRHRRIAA